MRFVSDKRGLSITVIAGSPEVRDPATRAVTAVAVPDKEATFSHDLLDEEAIRVAKLPRSEGGLANTDRRADGTLPDSPFRGLQQDGSGKFLPVEIRLAVFDTEVAQLQHKWTDDEREEIEQLMLASPYNGSEFVQVKPIPAGLPWNGYDSVADPEQILYIASLTNSDLSKILSYEKENQARSDVIDALESEIALLGEAEVVVNA